MSHLGDYDVGSAVYKKFTTYRPSTGAAYTLGGTPAVSVYKDGSATQSTAGVTLTADFDSLVGLNHVEIDTSADGTFYSAGSHFEIVITTGTVDSVSVVGAVVGSFDLRKSSALKPTAAGRTLDVSTGGEAGIDWSNIGSPTTAVNLSATNIDVDQVVASVSGAVGSVTGNVGGNVVGSVASVTAVSTGAITSGSFAAGAIDNAAIAADAIGSSELAATAVSEIATGVRTELATELARIDVTISSRAWQDDLDTIGGAMDVRFDGVDAVLSKFETMIQAAGGSPGDWEYRGDALRNLPPMVRQELAVELGRIDVNISSRLASVAYTAPANSTIAEIAAVTAKLDTTLQAASGSPGDWEFRADALRNAPASSGGGSAPSGSEVAAAVWAHATRTLTALDEDSTSIDIDNTVRSAVGLSAANLDTQMSSIATDADAAATVAAKLDTLLEEAGGSPGEYRLTENSVRKVGSVVPTAEQNADTLLDRDMSVGQDNGSPTRRTPRQALRILRNKWSISGNTQTITKEDDATTSWTQTLTGTAGADPVTATDPAG